MGNLLLDKHSPYWGILSTMRLGTYINDHYNSGKVAFGREVGVKGVSTIDRYCSGEREPSALIRARIIEKTDGLVTIEDMHATRLEWEKSRKSDAA